MPFNILKDPKLSSRYKRQATDQDWGNVWPAPRSFHPATVPLAVRQGYPAKGQAPPDKWGNAELMKIPNFLHLTPPVIERQCEALKSECCLVLGNQLCEFFSFFLFRYLIIYFLFFVFVFCLFDCLFLPLSFSSFCGKMCF